MTCYHPLKGWRGRENGRLVFDERHAGLLRVPITVPCGSCLGCRLERSRQWAIRCVNEASLHENNSYVTLTYRNEDLPEDMSLNKRHFQLFMKRLRKNAGHKIRYFHCGEYGDENGRPHYHACLFGHDFEDKTLWKIKKGIPLYVSQELEEQWQLGFCTVGAVTYQSSAYVARYILKKVTGTRAQSHYEWTDPKTGQVHQRLPEYVTMSRRPGVGAEWIEKFQNDVYPHDYQIHKGKKYKPPKFYDQSLGVEERRTLKASRIAAADTRAADNTADRLKVREKVQEARIQNLSRNLGKEEK